MNEHDTRVIQARPDAVPFNGEGTRVFIEVDGHHEAVSNDPPSAVTGGDGIGEDQGLGTLAGSGADDVVSDPTTADSDGDGVADGRELAGWEVSLFRPIMTRSGSNELCSMTGFRRSIPWVCGPHWW
jgi:hypothetical protein